MEAVQRLCRVCTKENMENLPLNFEIEGKHRNITLREIIRECSSIQIEESDELSQEVCKNCARNAETAFSFLVQCREAELFFNNKREKRKLDEYAKKQKDLELCKQLLQSCSDIDLIQEKTVAEESVKEEEITIDLECTKISPQLRPRRNVMYSCGKYKRTFKSTAERKMQNCNSERDIPEVEGLEIVVGKTSKSTKSVESQQVKIEEEDDVYDDSCEFGETGEEDNDDPKEEESLELDIEKTLHTAVELSKGQPQKRRQRGERLYSCECCDDPIKNRTHLTVHLQKKHSGPKSCKKCNVAFTSYYNLKQHVQLKRCRFGESPTGGLHYSCQCCDDPIKSRTHLTAHLREKHSGPKSCKKCNVAFANYYSLKQHVQLKRCQSEEFAIERLYSCEVCSKTFKHRRKYTTHKRTHLTERQCSFCDLKFPSIAKLYLHGEEMHRDEKEVVCEVCGKRFFKQRGLRTHMLLHSGKRPHQCEFCGKSFAMANNLLVHTRVHTGEKPYACDTCDKRFSQYASLYSHMVMHTDKMDYACTECGKRFSRSSSMHNHVKRHLAEKKFPCNVCGKAFTFSNERNRHMMIHSGEKKHVCDFCGKAFNKRTHLGVHLKIHTGETPHVCEVCGKGFIQADYLRTHLNTHNVKSSA